MAIPTEGYIIISREDIPAFSKRLRAYYEHCLQISNAMYNARFDGITTKYENMYKAIPTFIRRFINHNKFIQKGIDKHNKGRDWDIYYKEKLHKEGIRSIQFVYDCWDREMRYRVESLSLFIDAYTDKHVNGLQIPLDIFLKIKGFEG